LLTAALIPVAYVGAKVAEISGIAMTIPVTSTFLAYHFVGAEYGQGYGLICAAIALVFSIAIFSGNDNRSKKQKKPSP
jgi:hypothetical protein